VISFGLRDHCVGMVVASVGRALVTGGCGFIGTHLVRKLLTRNEEVIVLDDLSSGDPRRLPDDPRVKLIVGSVTDANVVRAAIAGCSTVFHLAGLVGMELVTRVPDATYRVSIEGAANVLASAERARVVMLSSSCVYGHTDHQTCREDHEVTRELAVDFDGGVPGYATGKFEMEQMALRTGRSIVVRPFNIVGPGQSHAHGMVLPRFIRAACRGEDLIVLGDGTQARAFTYVADFVAALVRLATMSWPPCERLLNLGNPTPTSILDLARMVIAVTESSSSIARLPYRDRYPQHRDVRWRVPDTTRADGVLGQLAWTDLGEIIRASVGAERCS
jgi:UDP-glucose 4-epimerase